MPRELTLYEASFKGMSALEWHAHSRYALKLIAELVDEGVLGYADSTTTIRGAVARLVGNAPKLATPRRGSPDFAMYQHHERAVLMWLRLWNHVIVASFRVVKALDQFADRLDEISDRLEAERGVTAR
jgi:hypothetical protein